MALTIDTLVLGPLETNCYVLRSEGDCWVVDPGMMPQALLKFLDDQKASPTRILLTHGHADHIAGVDEVTGAFPDAIVCCPAADAHMFSDADANMSRPFGLTLTAEPADELVGPGQLLLLGTSEWNILDTSGHTPGGVSYYCRSEAVVLTGDALFAGSIGRTDIPGASSSRLLRNIETELLCLPEHTRVLAGHGPETTVGAEKQGNPFFCDR